MHLLPVLLPILLSAVLPIDTAQDATSAGPAEEWSRFRGPNGGGRIAAADLPTDLDPKGPALRWRIEVPPGFSSPVLANGAIYLTAHEGKQVALHCFDAESGAKRWSAPAPKTLEKDPKGPNSPVSATPAVAAGRVFVFYENQGLLAYDAREGQLLWQLELGPFTNPYGMSASPIEVDGRVLMLCDQDVGSFLACVDAAEGKELWRQARAGATHGFSTPLVHRSADGAVEVIVSGAFGVRSYALADGRELWRASGMAWQAKSVPVLGDGELYVHSWMADPRSELKVTLEPVSWAEAKQRWDADQDGKLSRDETPDAEMKRLWFLFDIDKDKVLGEEDWSFFLARGAAQNGLYAVKLGGEGDVTSTHVRWRYERGLPNIPSPLLLDGRLFVLKEGGILTVLDAAKGEKLSEERIEGGIDGYFASPVAADGKIYTASHQGVLCVLSAQSPWKVIDSAELEEEIWATPAIAPGRLYVRSQKALYCYAGS
jgi:outer membrane protein assembly factor BamB